MAFTAGGLPVRELTTFLDLISCHIRDSSEVDSGLLSHIAAFPLYGCELPAPLYGIVSVLSQVLWSR